MTTTVWLLADGSRETIEHDFTMLSPGQSKASILRALQREARDALGTAYTGATALDADTVAEMQWVRLFNEKSDSRERDMLKRRHRGSKRVR